MVFGRRGRFWTFPASLAMAGGKMLRKGHSYARKAYSKARVARRHNRRVLRRRLRRKGRMVRRFGFADQKVVRMFYDMAETQAINNSAAMSKPCYLVMNDVGKPHPMSTPTATYTTMAGYGLFKTLYTSFVVLGSKLTVTIRPGKFINEQKATSGTSTFPDGWWPSFKWGVLLHDAPNSGTYSTWTQIVCDPSARHKTWTPKSDGSGPSSTLTVGYSPKKFWGVSNVRDAFDDYGAVFGSTPTSRCYAVLWIQPIDQATVPFLQTIQVHWRLTSRVLVKDLKGFGEMNAAETLLPIPN